MSDTATRAALERVAAALREEGGLLADALLDEPQIPGDDPGLGAQVAAGPRAASDPAAYAAVIEAVREGDLLHDGRSRILSTEDPDLALLAGDRLYALGLAWLADLADVAAVRELADVIAVCARARAEGEPGLAAAGWEAGVVAIGRGDGPGASALTGRPGRVPST